ncbi:flavin reductase family protein [Actinomadura fibrosa]|uniref:flavin reductase family protein n=1 Tax=Actinomadura fibrosa TaxID=111802 RepID=UPI0013F16528|nr:flavin reductase family protein [Actinomadura fibrosa]
MTGAELRRVAAAFATGVCVVTAQDAALGPHGMTVNAFTTLSLDPPTVLLCLNRASTTRGVLAGAPYFAVNVLRAGQAPLARRFATRSNGKFDGIGWHRTARDVPVLDGALALLECEPAESFDVHTHSVLVGNVLSAAVDEGSPLLFHRGRMIGEAGAAR